jgi:hypothetical protein
MLALALAVTGVRTPHVTAVSVTAIAVLGIIGTGFAYVLNYQIITSEGATIASTVTYLLPVVAIVLGVLVLGETVTAATLAGIGLVLAGVALTRRRVQARQAATGQETRTDDPVSDDAKRRSRTSTPRVQKVINEDRKSRNELPASKPSTTGSTGQAHRPIRRERNWVASRSARLMQIRKDQRGSESAEESLPPKSGERDRRWEPGERPPPTG